MIDMQQHWRSRVMDIDGVGRLESISLKHYKEHTHMKLHVSIMKEVPMR
jgi:hypothetical protein